MLTQETACALGRTYILLPFKSIPALLCRSRILEKTKPLTNIVDGNSHSENSMTSTSSHINGSHVSRLKRRAQQPR